MNYTDQEKDNIRAILKRAQELIAKKKAVAVAQNDFEKSFNLASREADLEKQMRRDGIL